MSKFLTAAFSPLMIVGAWCSCGCQPATSSPAVAPWRTDPASVEKRFRLLAPPQSVHWQGGALGVENARLSMPGPSDYFFRGFLQLDEAAAAELAATYDWKAPPADFAQIAGPPEVPSALRWRCAEEFTRDHLPDLWQGTLAFDADAGIVYFDLINIGVKNLP